MLPKLSSVQDAKVLNAGQGHVVPQNPRHVRYLPEVVKQVVAEHEEMQSIAGNKVMDWTSHFLPDGVLDISTTFVYKLESSLKNNIKTCKAKRAVRNFHEILGVHYVPLTSHALVPSDPSLQILFFRTMRHTLHLKRMDDKMAFLNPPLLYEVWVHFLLITCTHLGTYSPN